MQLPKLKLKFAPLETWIYILLFVGGFAAGIINTITLSLLIFTGLPADLANATNRVGAMVQTITAIGSVRRSKRTRFLFKDGMWFLVPAIVGSVIGAFLAVEIDPKLLRYIIGAIMLMLLITLVTNPKKWAGATDLQKSHKTVANWLWIFAIAIYAGFLQMGIGIMILAVLVLVAKYSLRDANIIKLMLAVILVLPAFIVFVVNSEIQWVEGITLAIGQGVGGFIGARYILFLPKANLIIKWMLIVILSVSSVILLKIPQLILQLF